MSTFEIISVVFLVVMALLQVQQNRVLREGNKISNGEATVKLDVLAKGKNVLKRYWPMAVMTVMMGATWAVVPFSENLRQQKNTDLMEFDNRAKPKNPVDNYMGGLNGCSANVNARVYYSRQSSYKLALACFFFDGTHDLLDTPGLEISNLYDIVETPISMVVSWPTPNPIPNVGLHIAILNVPNGVQIAQFSTLRQARALGVLIPEVPAIGPPQFVQERQVAHWVRCQCRRRRINEIGPVLE